MRFDVVLGFDGFEHQNTAACSCFQKIGTNMWRPHQKRDAFYNYYSDVHDQLHPPLASAPKFYIQYAHPISPTRGMSFRSAQNLASLNST